MWRPPPLPLLQQSRRKGAQHTLGFERIQLIEFNDPKILTVKIISIYM